MSQQWPVAALLEYDGTGYAGFQLQKGKRTIQGELEKGLHRITAEWVRVVCAGRTDAGVHARGQVVHLQVPWRHGLMDLLQAWNANLPEDIAVRAVALAPAGFHARFSARSRVYRYQIHNEPVRSPLYARYAWHVRRPLALEGIQSALSMLLGTRDLRALGRPPQGENTVRTILRADCSRQGSLLCIEVEADAFLQHMMRRLAWLLVAVGVGRLAVGEFRAIIEGRSVHLAAGLAPPAGLCLMAVHYEPGLIAWLPAASEPWQKESCFA